MSGEKMVRRFFYFDYSENETHYDRILYDALEGRKVAHADWADPANRSSAYGGGMEETFGRRRDLDEKVPESDCVVKMEDRYAFHKKWVEANYDTRWGDAL